MASLGFLFRTKGKKLILKANLLSKAYAHYTKGEVREGDVCVALIKDMTPTQKSILETARAKALLMIEEREKNK